MVADPSKGLQEDTMSITGTLTIKPNGDLKLKAVHEELLRALMSPNGTASNAC